MIPSSKEAFAKGARKVLERGRGVGFAMLSLRCHPWRALGWDDDSVDCVKSVVELCLAFGFILGSLFGLEDWVDDLWCCRLSDDLF